MSTRRMACLIPTFTHGQSTERLATTYYLTQPVSGHGKVSCYYNKVGGGESWFVCTAQVLPIQHMPSLPRWYVLHHCLVLEIGSFELAPFVENVLGGEDAWSQVVRLIVATSRAERVNLVRLWLTDLQTSQFIG